MTTEPKPAEGAVAWAHAKYPSITTGSARLAALWSAEFGPCAPLYLDPANTIAQLQERVRGLEHRVGELSDYLGAANARTDKARARNRALVEALEKFGRHGEECPCVTAGMRFWTDADGKEQCAINECTCGLTEALRVMDDTKLGLECAGTLKLLEPEHRAASAELVSLRSQLAAAHGDFAEERAALKAQIAEAQDSIARYRSSLEHLVAARGAKEKGNG